MDKYTIKGKILDVQEDSGVRVMEKESGVVYYIYTIGTNIRNITDIDFDDKNTYQTFIVGHFIRESEPKVKKAKVPVKPTKKPSPAAKPRKKEPKMTRTLKKIKEKPEKEEMAAFDYAYECAYDTYQERIANLKKGEGDCNRTIEMAGKKTVVGKEWMPTWEYDRMSKFGRLMDEWAESRNKKAKKDKERTGSSEGKPRVEIMKGGRFALKFTDTPEPYYGDCPAPKEDATRAFLECLEEKDIDVPERVPRKYLRATDGEVKDECYSERYAYTVDEDKKKIGRSDDQKSLNANQIKDIQTMARVECGKDITTDEAIMIGNDVLRNSKGKVSPIYHVSTERLCKLVRKYVK